MSKPSNRDAEPALELVHNEFYVSIGDVVAGKYRIEHVLGVGGMAFVMSARHVELDERFALKFLAERFLGDRSIMERFTQEAKAACQLRSEHVARVYDVGIHEGAPFFVMEHLEGRDLATVITETGALSIEDAVEYTMQACEALAVAHRRGIIHRDIKPENLFLIEHGGLPSIKLLDFGISKLALTGAPESSRLTGQLTLGTPCYMSPEQIRSTASVDPRSDLWSLGVVLYELLAGVEAFRAETATGVCAAVLEQEAVPLCELRPDIPYELAEVVARCMEKDADRRFADVAELAVALLPFAPTRALVSAERSSSLMKSAPRTYESNPRISSVRPSAQGASGAPVARTIEPPSSRGRSRSRESRNHRGTVALVVASLCFVAAAGAAYTKRVELRGASADDRPAPAAAAEAPPVVSEALPAVGIASTPIAIRAVPPAPVVRAVESVMPAVRGRPRAVAAPATASASASAAHASASVEVATARPSPAPVIPSAVAAPTVELGY
jgi:serine/threonine-protein kinase